MMFSFLCRSTELKQLLKGFNRMTIEFDRLKAEVAETSAKIDEVIAFIRDNAGDPVALKAFADELDAGQAKLTAAMTSAPAPVTPVPGNSLTQAEKDAKESAELAVKQAATRFNS